MDQINIFHSFPFQTGSATTTGSNDSAKSTNCTNSTATKSTATGSNATSYCAAAATSGAGTTTQGTYVIGKVLLQFIYGNLFCPEKLQFLSLQNFFRTIE